MIKGSFSPQETHLTRREQEVFYGYIPLPWYYRSNGIHIVMSILVLIGFAILLDRAFNY